MKRGDDVFFFTLVDLFAQLMFFGLVLFVITRENERAEMPVGISNISALSDSLTRLTAEAKRAALLRDSIKTLTNSNKTLSAKVKAQYGLPPCNGNAKYVATAILRDTQVELTGVTPEFLALIGSVVKRPFEEVRILTPAAFRVAFEPLTKAFPECRYFVRIERRNFLEAPVLAVHSAFRSQLSKAGL